MNLRLVEQKRELEEIASQSSKKFLADPTPANLRLWENYLEHMKAEYYALMQKRADIAVSAVAEMDLWIDLRRRGDDKDDRCQNSKWGTDK